MLSICIYVSGPLHPQTKMKENIKLFLPNSVKI